MQRGLLQTWFTAQNPAIVMEYIFYINNSNVLTFHVILPNIFKFLHRWFHTENVKNVEETYYAKKKMSALSGLPGLLPCFDP